MPVELRIPLSADFGNCCQVFKLQTRIDSIPIARMCRNRQRLPSNRSIERAKSTVRTSTAPRKRASDTALTSYGLARRGRSLQACLIPAGDASGFPHSIHDSVGRPPEIRLVLLGRKESTTPARASNRLKDNTESTILMNMTQVGFVPSRKIAESSVGLWLFADCLLPGVHVLDDSRKQ